MRRVPGIELTVKDAVDRRELRVAAVTRLVGRAREQVFLREELAAAEGGHGRLVLVGGEAGIGKTTLARDLARDASERGFEILTGHCYDLTNTPPYGPWLDLIAGYRPDGGAVPPAAFAGGRLQGTITDQAALFAEVHDFFAAVATQRPTLVVLEDLHWADPASIELLRYLGARIGTRPLLVCATYRVDELTRRHPFYQQLPALIREANALRLDLHRLDPHDLQELIAGQWPLTSADEVRLVRYLDQHAEGNPFFATELLRALQEGALLQRQADRWVLGEIDHLVLPALLRQVIDGRVDRLGEGMRQPLAIAAVIGQEVPLDLWAHVSDVEETTLLDIVERAIESHVMEGDRQGERVRFMHALTREALYDGIVPPRRRVWHRRVAKTLAIRVNADPDAVAYHFQEAGDPEAVEWLIQAGDRAQRAYAWVTASERFGAAAGLLADVPGEERRRGWLLYRLARLERFSRPAEGVRALMESERLAGLAADAFLAGDARYSRGLLRCYTGDFGLGVSELGDGLDMLDALPADHARASDMGVEWLADALPAKATDSGLDEDAAGATEAVGIHYRRGSYPYVLAPGGHLRQARELAEAYVAQVDIGVPVSGLVRSNTGHAYLGLGIACGGLGLPDASRRAYELARASYRELDHHAVIALSLLTELRDRVIPYETTDPGQRRRLAAEAEAALRRAGGALPAGLSPRLGWLSCFVLDGRWDEALQIVEELPTPGNVYFRREIAGTIAAVTRFRGDAATAWNQIHTIMPEGPGMVPGAIIHQEALVMQRLAADLCLDAGDLMTARAWLEAHDRWLAWNGSVLGRSDGELAWARLARATGDLVAARTRATEALRLASEPLQPLALLAAHRFLGELATARGQTDEAEHHLSTALTLSEACAVPSERMLTLRSLAGLRLATGASPAAAAALDEANRLGRELGIVPPRALDAPVTESRTIATDPIAVHQDSSGEWLKGLTRREREVARLLARGCSNREIAEALFIGERTVETHVGNILSKLGCTSRAQVAALADRGQPDEAGTLPLRVTRR